MKPLFSILAALSLSTAAIAHEYSAGSLDIDHPMAFETAATAKVGGGYMTITNTGESADALIGVKADFPRVMIHQTVEEDGIAKMNHVDRIDIPAGESVELTPGGYHVMFMGLEAPLVDGEKFPATLIFENAGEVEVTFNVEARTTEAMDHSGHDHSGHGAEKSEDKTN
ncbi:MAG: copper chaperone PCu(A)C [Pseudomonadota bacterium]